MMCSYCFTEKDKTNPFNAYRFKLEIVEGSRFPEGVTTTLTTMYVCENCIDFFKQNLKDSNFALTEVEDYDGL